MDIEAGARTVVEQCLDVRPDEDVLVVTDEKRYRIAETIRKKSVEYAKNTLMVVIEETGQHGAEPSQQVTELMKKFDVVIAPTTYSLTHTKARIAACKSGSRVVTMPGITEEIFTTSLIADYDLIAQRSERIFEMVGSAETARVTSPSGTDIIIDIEEKYWETDTGMIHQPGEFGNLPAGEVDGAPVASEGVVVIDSLKSDGEELAPEGTRVLIEENQAKSISEDCRLSRAFDEVEGARNLAELGIGTNPEAVLIGNILQDEKVFGTCHFAFGDDTSYGKKNSCDIHWDAVVERPSIYLDGERVMKDGVLEVEL